MNCDSNFKIDSSLKNLEFSDTWILSKLYSEVSIINQLLQTNDFGTAAKRIYDFLWGDFCDWYIEMAKDRINSDDPVKKNQVLSVLIHVLETTLRLAHPFMPFITEEIWQMIKQRAPEMCSFESIMLSKYPLENIKFINKEIEADMNLLQPVVSSIRNIRAQYNIAKSKLVDVYFYSKQKSEIKILERVKSHLINLAKVANVQIMKSPKDLPGQIATTVVGDVEIHVSLKGLIDVEKEKARLNKELEKIEKELKRIDSKLSNQGFVENARPELIEAEKENQSKLQESINIIKRSISSLQ